MSIKRFEDINAWQEARVLTNMIFESIKENKAMERNFRFKDQITSSAISIMANIAEGFSRKSNKEFIQFLFIAKGSISELQSHIYVARDQAMMTSDKFDETYKQVDRVARLTSSFISYLLKPNNPINPITL
jgi:four helix bundle protein